MALSVLEIVEEDCGGSNFLEFVVFSERHSETLVGKYYKDPQEPYNDWTLLDFYTAKNFINKKIYVRSPMTCTTENFKMCKKCFGERKFATKYLGIVCGQTISERLTQLVLRTFHTSGAAELRTILIIKNFIKEHLTDIINEDDKIFLKFDSNNIPQGITKLRGFVSIFESEDNKLVVQFDSDKEPTQNNDTISMLKSIQNLLKTNKSPNIHPVEYYLELMTLVLTVGTPYSSFVEMVFANMFMTHKVQKKFWRYHPDEKIVLKLGDKILAKHLSTLLGLLYQPNKNTIAEMDKLETIDLDNLDLTIYEKIFLSRI
jgi:succinate dehydrogenase flavin-adding protein (antitoxin of CptAB toxin-antitoxin module)